MGSFIIYSSTSNHKQRILFYWSPSSFSPLRLSLGSTHRYRTRCVGLSKMIDTEQLEYFYQAIVTLLKPGLRKQVRKPSILSALNRILQHSKPKHNLKFTFPQEEIQRNRLTIWPFRTSNTCVIWNNLTTTHRDLNRIRFLIPQDWLVFFLTSEDLKQTKKKFHAPFSRLFQGSAPNK